MKTASIAEAKEQLSALIDEVRAGESVVLTEDGVPVARLMPPAPEPEDDETRIVRLERKGILVRGGGPRVRLEDLAPFPPGTPLTDAVDALIAEREESW